MKTASPEYLALRDFVFLAKDPRALVLDARKLHRRRLLRHPLFPVLHAEDFDGPRALGALAELIGARHVVVVAETEEASCDVARTLRSIDLGVCRT
jgi:hypothetical protein